MAKKKKLPAGLARYMAAKRKAKKAKRRTANNRKPAPVKVRPRKTKRTKMAKRKSTRRRSGGGSRRSANMSLQDAAMKILGLSAGYIGGGALVGVIPVDDPMIKGGILAGGGAFGATKTKGFLQDAMLGVGMRGTVSLGQQLLPGVVNGIGNLPAQLPEMTQEDVDYMEDVLVNGLPDQYQQNLMGYDEDGADSVDEFVEGMDDRNGVLMGYDENGDEVWEVAD